MDKKQNLQEQKGDVVLPCVSGSLPSIDEAGSIAVTISESVVPKLTAQEQALFIAGFQECIKYLRRPLTVECKKTF